jgi:hypothetical protein
MKKEHLRELAFATVAASSMAPVAVFAEGEQTTMTSDNYDTQLVDEFKDAGTKIGTAVVAIIGIAMGVLVIKQVFKVAVSFFKSATTK